MSHFRSDPDEPRFEMVVDVVSAAQLRSWARAGVASKLERAVFAGQGRRLLAEAESLSLSSHIPQLIAKCDALHAAVERGSLLELQELIESEVPNSRRKFAMCRDEAGVGLLHKAVYCDFMDIATWLVDNFPLLVHQRDSLGRTPLHYAAVCRDPSSMAALLERAGAARGARDAAGHAPAHYRGAARTQLALPHAEDMPPPTDKQNGLVITRHKIRIWCHDCDMARLQRVVWEGHGARLLSEVSNQPVVKKFLEAVPYIMNTIREIHNAVVQNDLEGLMKHAGDPVPPQILSSRDSNNMTVMHKAAGLGHGGILGYIADRYPQGINDVDNDGRTPLHYAAAVRDDQHIYNTLVSLGADEGALDNKNRVPGYYVNRPQEIDKNMLKILPDAPRTPSSAYPPSWDWKILNIEGAVELKKPRKKKLRTSNENISSKTNSNSISENTFSNRRGMNKSSTHDMIKNLPDLDDTNRKPNGNVDINQDSEVVEENGVEKDEDPTEHHEEAPTEEISREAQNIVGTNNGEKQTEENDEHVEENADESAYDNEAYHSEGEPHDQEDNKSQSEEVEVNTQQKEVEEQENSDHEENEGHGTSRIENVGHENSQKQNEDHEDSQEEIEDSQNKNDGDDNTQKELGGERIKSASMDHVNKAKNNEDTDEAENDKEVHKSDIEESQKDDSDMSSQVSDNNGDIIRTTEASKKVLQEEQETGETTKNTEEDELPAKEGNNKHEHNEDDDDVQMPGDSNSEYSDVHHQSTAEAINSASAKRGSESNGRNTRESLIEGIISGEAEQDSQDASITQNDETVQGEILVVEHEIDPEVTDLINTANMEMLATLVLNGEGSRLVGKRSRNVELQAFLDNVPTYMQKINKVHLAAREGNLRDLQAALDRRKFAIARDPISPNGATPLHVATVCGKTNIIKYLGGRFPETLSAVDFEGRTALHYAASIPDNGHYYNLLQQLGANAKDLDDTGRSAEDYYKDPNILPYTRLLSDFGISEMQAKEMLSDKGTGDAANGHVDIPIFKTDEGRYLAKSLGDPLIKGLTEVANVKPKDPVAFLASFLQNFPEHEKPRLGTQESNVIVTSEAAEVENEQPPPGPAAGAMAGAAATAKGLARDAARTATRPHRPIDVVTIDPQPEASPDAPEAALSSVNRDEHGQSMLHFAAARTHTRNALFQLLQESDVSLGYRDELYRTARDVSIQANVKENTSEIDKWVLHLAARGNTEKIMQLVMEGYDHILDIVDDEGVSVTDIVAQRGDTEMSNLLASIPTFEESRESLHGAVRRGDLQEVKDVIAAEGGRTLTRAQNSFGRTALHIAVLAQHEDIVAYLAQNCPELLRIGDNLERTPLHYAMGVDKIESLSRILIRAGAKRVLKDLKGRQPSYYFMNKSDILRLMEEEEVY